VRVRTSCLGRGAADEDVDELSALQSRADATREDDEHMSVSLPERLEADRFQLGGAGQRLRTGP